MSRSRGTAGFVHQKIAPDASDEELAHALVVLYAGREAERLAPSAWASADTNGGEHLSLSELAALVVPREPDPAIANGPADEAQIAFCSRRLGPEESERCRRLASELVYRAKVVGHLERIADELLWRGELSAGDVEALLAPAA